MHNMWIVRAIYCGQLLMRTYFGLPTVCLLSILLSLTGGSHVSAVPLPLRAVEDTGLEFMVANSQQELQFAPSESGISSQPSASGYDLELAVPPAVATIRNDAEIVGDNSGNIGDQVDEGVSPYALTFDQTVPAPGYRLPWIPAARPRSEPTTYVRPLVISTEDDIPRTIEEAGDLEPVLVKRNVPIYAEPINPEDVAVAIGRMGDTDEWSPYDQNSGIVRKLRYPLRDAGSDLDVSGDDLQQSADVWDFDADIPTVSETDRSRDRQQQEENVEDLLRDLAMLDGNPPDTFVRTLEAPQEEEDVEIQPESNRDFIPMGGSRLKRLSVPASQANRPPLVRQDAVDIPDDESSGSTTNAANDDSDEDDEADRDRAVSVILDAEASQLRQMKKSIENALRANQQQQDMVQARTVLRDEPDVFVRSQRALPLNLKEGDDGRKGDTLEDMDKGFDAVAETINPGGSLVVRPFETEDYDPENVAQNARLYKRALLDVPFDPLPQDEFPVSKDEVEERQLDDDDEDDDEDAAAAASRLEMPSPESDDLQEAVAGRFRVCDMVHNKFYRQMSFTGKTLEVDECYVSCERREGDRVFSHIFKLVDWPCGVKLEGKCDKQGVCSAF
ncbi:uncharacterized protein LOC129587607 isoform X2 [Paramacrobiotus metropolitanus]|uniref:uncharacterized protein LOC129587607 isoform X2 n=1 Tax=Paramacrobiotus metropolitanus TaxID=2943436 RepID=UPI0024457CC3|nr:uncharacterized protein LOC129587607 isoform X2 [Paramacrobiotus metropolitanus]